MSFNLVNGETQTLLLPERSQLSFIFAKFVTISRHPYALLIDNELSLIVFDLTKQKILFKESLIRKTKLFN